MGKLDITILIGVDKSFHIFYAQLKFSTTLGIKKFKASLHGIFISYLVSFVTVRKIKGHFDLLINIKY